MTRGNPRDPTTPAEAAASHDELASPVESPAESESSEPESARTETGQDDPVPTVETNQTNQTNRPGSSGSDGDEERGAGERRLSAALRAARVKAACQIEDVIRGHGIALRMVGDRERFVGLCPFHNERRGSFTVYPVTQSFYCFGCHVGGDVITFIRLYHNASFAEALQRLGEDGLERATATAVQPPTSAEAEVAQPLTPPALAQRRRNKRPALSTSTTSAQQQPGAENTEDDDNGDTQLLRSALLWTTSVIAIEGLSHAPQVLTYLGERGISYELARACHLGYLTDDYLEKALTGNAILAPIARAMGLLNHADHCALARRLIIPEIRQGMATQLIGRVIPGNDTPLAEIKYYLLRGTATKGLLGYGAALARLEGHLAVMRQQTGRDAQWPSAPGAPVATPSASTSTARSAAQLPRQPPFGQEHGMGKRSAGSLGGAPLRGLLGILVLEGALDYVIAHGWNLPVLPVAILSSFPSQGQLAELLELQQRSGGLPLLLQLDADEAGARGMAFIARFLDDVGAPWRQLPPLPRLPHPSPAYKDLGEMGLLGRGGRALMMACLEQVIADGARRSDLRPIRAGTPWNTVSVRQ